ncbi:acetylating acetaldehyde dehydrogenase [Mycolicibacterium aubagnense]|uniref:Acetaldehyde dehydrogenase n=1 Tax=Mycolicibacterium aubagnense TaxID=319707 RepID=A0ABN5Z1B6_9MYCO|nr:acetylating acetaldehyde dehydrogenase [Mycolicibacterium aubagnense]TLH66756.1 hypothetical protein C1S80_06720 [Mycolicibacterium aubagnense]WGI31652.1 acetylating acetaldehyde dehydrogenase [Mycolicibacterium aubagnense]BBX86869.1 hypothetical protein MAUB_47420 [Mycolicibacterium aubagnense]
MQHNPTWPVAIIGSGNIGTDLMIKILRSDGPLRLAAMVGIDPDSDGLARAARMGVPTTAEGVDGLLKMPNFSDIKLVFDATSAGAHRANWTRLQPTGVRMLDLTPAALGPYCVPVVNLDEHLHAQNLNMVTCGGQATVPIVAAVSECGIVSYAEIVSSVSAKSAGPGTRANIDEFQRVQFETFTSENPLYIPETGKFAGTRVTALLEVTGAAHYLPPYAGNLDIMTSAAKAAAETIAHRTRETAGATT